MQMPKPLDSKLVRKMNRAFFDVDVRGVLIYQDPVIGPLNNDRRRLRVAVNGETDCLELQVGGAVKRRFELARGVERACQEAFKAYFEQFEQACVHERAAA